MKKNIRIGRKFLQKKIGALPRFWKRAILLVFDFFVLSFAAWTSYSLRIGDWSLPHFDQFMLVLAAPTVALPVFVRFGLYRSVIRYLPERAFWSMANAVLISTLLWVGVLFIFEISRQGTMPRSVPAIYCLMAIFVVAGSRFMAKYLLWSPRHQQYSQQVVIYGAGAAGSQLATALLREGNKYVAGFLDDDTTLQGRDVSGIRVFSPSRLQYLIETMGVKEVVISIPSIEAARRQELVAKLSHHPVKIRTLPAIADLASGRYLISQIREINIDDILGRSAIPAKPELLREMIEDRAILVSGAGGSIGSELCKLIVKWRPRKLVLFEANEFALYQIDRELQKRAYLPIVAVLGSVTDDRLVRRTLKSHCIQTVLHAAAHKHVPLVEANVLEGIRNNIFGTRTVAEAAFDAGVEHFVLISTDKAVRPPNVMGATKRWAELVVADLADRARASGSNQKFCAVRFGNVLGSNGSVVPLFKEQIADGGPVTVTDEEMTRYFMSIHEAAELIVQAGALAEGGDTFLLDMGKPVRIRDLAENMIRLAGLSVADEATQKGDIRISIIGRRPAEKTHEELFYDPSNAVATQHPKILRALQNADQGTQLDNNLSELTKMLVDEDELGARRILFDLINEHDKNAIRSKIVSIKTAKRSFRETSTR